MRLSWGSPSWKLSIGEFAGEVEMSWGLNIDSVYDLDEREVRCEFCKVFLEAARHRSAGRGTDVTSDETNRVTRRLSKTGEGAG